MSEIKFTHLHVHSEYSLLDGSSKIKELVSRTKELGMDSIAITDHGSMYGAIDFYKEAKNNNIKPIIGCEVYVASKDRFDKTYDKSNYSNHLVLLAKNNIGYNNLIKLVSIGYTEGFYYRPRIDKEILKEHSEGLIALSACLAGPLCRSILRHSYDKAVEEAKKYKEIFGDDFYIELQNHGIKEQLEVNPLLVKISKELNIKLVATNDIHYVYENDVKAHEVLLCIQTGKTMLDEDRMIYEGGQFYLKSPEEMYELFKNYEGAIENTALIAEQCNVEFEFNKYKLPKFDVPNNLDPYQYLHDLTFGFLEQKLGDLTDEIKERAMYELTTIKDMGFVEYFLIVWDFIKYAKDNNIPVGPGRGSAAGSLVSYALSITTINPLEYDLIFERFLNSERISMPDIDIDFCYERRQEVIDYVIEKYGKDKVVQIITFGTMGARGAIRDVGRALAIPYASVDRIAKMIPFALGITINKALELNPDLKKAYQEEKDTKELIDMSLRLEGLPRHSSTHAAGVVISDRPIMEYVPLNQNDGVITTQYPMNTLEELGLLKMDFLGLRTLTVIQTAVDEIKRTKNIDIDIEKIPLDDKNVYHMISQGKTEGVFQLESSGMKSFLKELKPDNIEEIIAGISLYRPGPMEFIPKYIKGKNNKDTITYDTKELESILNTTYGCIVYQEQVMQIVRDLAGYSLGRSDLVRRAMSKKKTDVMEEERKNFVHGNEEVKGCLKNGISEKVANKIFDEMIDFAKYAFNKSHAAAYAYVGYQTAWLKVNYKVEFMSALLTSVMDSNNKIAEYIAECKQMNIDILPPDINKSFANFTVDNGKIRFGLVSLKNVGRNAINAIIAEREKNGDYVSLTDFIERLNGNDVNKRTIESLVLAGGFDSLGGLRSQYYAVYEKLLSDLSTKNKKVMEGQINFFDLNSEEAEKQKEDVLPDIKEFSEKQTLAYEKEIVGLYLTGHPLNEFMDVIEKNATVNSKDFIVELDEFDNLQTKVDDGQFCILVGIVASKKIIYTKSNQRMAFVTIEDLTGTIELILFPNTFERYNDILVEDKILLVQGNISLKDDEAKVLCNNIRVLEKSNEKTDEKLWIKITNETNSTKIMSVLKKYKGNTEIIIYNATTKEKLKMNNQYNVMVCDELMLDLKRIVGEKSVVLK